jgi:hypothetical protein
VDLITGVTTDARNGPMLIHEQYVTERKALDVFARLPMAAVLRRHYRFFRNISPSDARMFVKAVRSGRIKHSVCLEICENQHLFDPDIHAKTVRPPVSVEDFVQLFPLMANAVTEFLATPVRDQFDLLRSLMGPESLYGGEETECAHRDLTQAAARLNGYYTNPSFAEYLRRDLGPDLYRGEAGDMDWAMAVLFARAGDPTALRATGEPTAAVAIATKIIESSVHWIDMVELVEEVARRDIRELTGASRQQIGAVRDHLHTQAGRIIDLLSPGTPFSYQQVKLAEYFYTRGFIAAAWRGWLNGNAPADYTPAADIAHLRIQHPTASTPATTSPGSPEGIRSAASIA